MKAKPEHQRRGDGPDFEAPRRGRRKGQATKTDRSELSAEGNALVAALGGDFVDRRLELADCLLAFEQCPTRSPAKLSPALQQLAWRMLSALKRGDAQWFNRLIAVRHGAAFRMLASGDAPKLEDMVEPDGVLLAAAVQQQTAGKAGLLSDQQLSDIVNERLPDGSPTPTTKTLGKKFEQMGGKKNRRRGRKNT